ncbi:uncharacterized protein M421DRAFT_254086 [Didymella exigua CBS 183.55]|uniref:F-box domain-containing protein n=1 Tax=Didymella exigua CBS 183.55 TaxID=1150837 RepID=A0A6A5S3C9_9PLEO|nr:uncharacterized protein M421DRAFT_254086 [Didymella exigua CBS 183.55]KAF1932976.1 hypothetical protein M421DRAFT_254086 [Didymella exigua CBS 183.55]
MQCPPAWLHNKLLTSTAANRTCCRQNLPVPLQTPPLPRKAAHLPDMASNGLAEAFARLSNSDSRLDALEALIKELTPYEWRFVQSLTSTRTFQFDIIGRLPVELVSQIFSYLDASKPWQLQHVCRAWYEQLRSLDVLKPNLESWYDGTINLQGVDLEFCRRRARSARALRSGRAQPDSSLKISSRVSLTQQFLVRDKLIWLAHGLRQVNVVNLRSMTSKVLVDPSRGQIGQLHAADDLVAFSALLRGAVFVGEIIGNGPVKNFRIHGPSQRLALTCRHRTVACAMHLEAHTRVYIWNYDTSQCRYFDINRTALQKPMSNSTRHGLLLQPYTETVILCQFFVPARFGASRTTLLHWCFTYAGECLRGLEQALEGYSDESEVAPGGLTSSLAFVPASHDGLYMLRCNDCMSNGKPALPYLQYNDKIQAFTSPRHPRLYPTDSWDGGNVVWWKDAFIEGSIGEEIVVHRGTVSVPNLDPDIACGPREHRTFKEVLVNDTYIVRPFLDACYIFCYDHTVQLPGAKGTLHGVGPWEIIENRFPTASECS